VKKEMVTMYLTLRDPATHYEPDRDALPDLEQMQQATLLYKFKPALVYKAKELKHKHAAPKLAAKEIEQQRMEKVERQYAWARVVQLALRARVFMRTSPNRAHMPLAFVLYQRKLRKAYAGTVARAFFMAPFIGTVASAAAAVQIPKAEDGPNKKKLAIKVNKSKRRFSQVNLPRGRKEEKKLLLHPSPLAAAVPFSSRSHHPITSLSHPILSHSIFSHSILSHSILSPSPSSHSRLASPLPPPHIPPLPSVPLPTPPYPSSPYPPLPPSLPHTHIPHTQPRWTRRSCCYWYPRPKKVSTNGHSRSAGRRMRHHGRWTVQHCTGRQWLS
jgi:hypothetical protein